MPLPLSQVRFPPSTHLKKENRSNLTARTLFPLCSIGISTRWATWRLCLVISQRSMPLIRGVKSGLSQEGAIAR